MRKAIAFLLCFIVPAAANAQAFGVAMGAPVSRYAAKATSQSPYYFQIQVPDPNGEFEAYMAIATPATGVCKVSGIGRTHTNDEYGTDLRSAFDRLTGLLSAKYGKSDKFDFLKSGALWHEPREWVWSIYKKERTLSAYWTPDVGSSLPPSIQAVALETSSVDPSSGAYVNLSYEFSNFSACTKLLDGSDSSGL